MRNVLLLLALCVCGTGCRSAIPIGPSTAASRPATSSAEPATTEATASEAAIQQVLFVQAPDTGPQDDAPVPSAQWTLDQFLDLALSNNPGVAEARARVEAARGNWVQVGLPSNTVIGYSGQQLFSGGAAEQQGLYAEQEIVRGRKLQLNRAVAAQEIEKSQARLAAEQQRVMTDVRLGYYDILVAQRVTETSQELARVADEARKVVDSLKKANESSEVDVLRARLEVQSSRIVLVNAQNHARAAWDRLSAVVGTELQPAKVSGQLPEQIPEIVFGEALTRILGQSPEVALAISEQQRARRAVERACAEPIPNVDVQAVVQNDNGTGGANANLQVSMPIPWLNKNQGGIREAQAERTAAAQAIERVELSLKRRLASVYQRYADARYQVQEYSQPDGILDNAKAALELTRKGYEAGEFGHLELLNAQRTYSQSNLAYLQSLGELWTAVVEIEGLLLKDSLEGSSGGN